MTKIEAAVLTFVGMSIITIGFILGMACKEQVKMQDFARTCVALKGIPTEGGGYLFCVKDGKTIDVPMGEKK